MGISFFLQYVGFWIQFVTSFRYFVSNYGMDRSASQESYEEAFIDMLKMLTTENRWGKTWTTHIHAESVHLLDYCKDQFILIHFILHSSYASVV
jgi:hypothetical protein